MTESIAFLLADQNLPFTVALAVMLLIAALEGVGLVLGWQLSTTLESLLPDFNVDLDSPDIQGGALSRLLGWLRIGKVPVLMLLIIFLTAFGLIGLLLQSITHDLFGFLWPALPATVPAFLAALPVMRLLAKGLEKIMPRVETSAVSSDSFIGKIAYITLGTANQGQPAQAKLTDSFGATHYIMVEPDITGESFTTGTAVILVSRTGFRFRAIRNTNAALTD